MRKFYLLIVLLNLNLLVSAQDTELYRTWYLKEIQIEFGPWTNVIDLLPQISPTLTIAEDLTFTGMGACNSFGGTFTFDNEDNVIFQNFESTLLQCENQSLDEFETIYFHLFTADYLLPSGVVLNNQTGELELWFGSSTSIAYRFATEPLMSNEEIDIISKIQISPNPTSDYIHVKNVKSNSKYQIYNLMGQMISEGNLDVSNKIMINQIATGIYILKINNSTLKFIKK